MKLNIQVTFIFDWKLTWFADYVGYMARKLYFIDGKKLPAFLLYTCSICSGKRNKKGPFGYTGMLDSGMNIGGK